MPQSNSLPLDYQETFPEPQLELVDSKSVKLPDDTHGHWTVLLVYRGHW